MRTTRLPILMYHSVATSPAAATRRLAVRPAEFAAQLALLQAEGMTTLPFADVAAALHEDRPLPPRTVALTFDDGYADFHEVAFPLLQRYGCTATLFVTTGWLDDAGEHRAGRPLDRMLSWRQLDEIASAGIEIGAPVSIARMPRCIPSVAFMATVRTRFSPRCCSTSTITSIACALPSPTIRTAL